MDLVNKGLVKFDELLDIKRDFDGLLDEFKIPRGNNRFDQYEKIFAKALAETNPKDTGELRHSISELSDLEALTILRKAGILSNDKLKRILPILVSGHPTKLSRPSDKPDPSRNTMFEITLLNYLYRRGCSVSYEEGNDIVLEKDGESIAIECKRLRVVSNSSIKSNLRKAYQQLEKTRSNHSMGAVALGIEEDVFGKDELLLVQSGEYAEEALTGFNKEFIHKHGKWWQLRNFIKDPDFCPVVFVCVKATVYDFKNNITGTGFFMTANNTAYPATSNFENIRFLEGATADWSR